jgi:isopentenyl-diphosphate delta-isomerase
VFDDQNRLLMGQRSLKKKVYPGVWGESAAGHVDKGEFPEAAAHRELTEEMGFDTKLTFLKKSLTKFSNETHFTYYYIGKYNSEEINFQREEIEQVRFTKREEFDGLYTNPDKFIQEGIRIVKEIWDEKK